MSETKMKLEIEFENFEDLDRKLSSALRRSEIFKPKSSHTIKDIVKCINLYDFEYKKEHDMDSKVTKFFENATTYFSKVTEQNLYRYQNVLEYVDGEYQITNKITDKNLAEMRANMDESDLGEFDAFVEKYWADQFKKERKVSSKSEK